MLCSLLKSLYFEDQERWPARRRPCFQKHHRLYRTPGVEGTINFGQPVSAYEVFTVPADRIFVLEHILAVVTRGDEIPFPPGSMYDNGAVGYESDSTEFFQTLAFACHEPDGILQASYSIRLYVPSNAHVIVKVPLIRNQTGGAEVHVSGYYLMYKHFITEYRKRAWSMVF